MSKKLLHPLAVVSLAFFAYTPAKAEVHEFAVDPVHSQVGFEVRHLVAQTPGGFDDFTGSIWLDPEDVAGTLKVEGTVQVASVNTRNEQRDGHLKSPDFFDVENHPEMTLVSRGAKKKGDELLLLVDLTIRGVTKEVKMRADWGGVVKNPFTGTLTTGLTVTAKVNRKDFGILWNKALDKGGFLLGDDVNIRVQLEATVPPPETGEES